LGFYECSKDKTNEELYQFTHRTFLQYFTAFHLVRIHATTDKLAEFLLPKIEQREWDRIAKPNRVICEFCVCCYIFRDDIKKNISY
jgi:hypothetical protein